MSLIPRPIECLACGHVYAGLWDNGSLRQPEGQRCPKCGSLHTREAGAKTRSGALEQTRTLDSANHFGVGVSVTGHVHVHLHNVSTAYPIVFSKPEAINLAAWLFCMADPGGREFARTVEEIQRPQACQNANGHS